MNLRSRNKNTVLDKVSFYILLPLLIMAIFCLAVQTYYINSYVDMIVQSNNNILSRQLKNLEGNISSIMEDTAFLTDEHFKRCYTHQPSSGALESADINGTIEKFNLIKNKNPMIDSVLMLNFASNIVISDSGMHDMTEYLNSDNKYTDYEASYWRELKILAGGIQVLPPTTVMSHEGNKQIMPIIFGSVNGIMTKNLIIINLDIEKIRLIMANYQSTPNSKLLIYNKYTRRFYTDHNTELNQKEKLVKNITSEQNACFTYRDKMFKKYLCISYSPSLSLLSYSYVVMVPYSDLSVVSNLKILSGFLIVFMLGIICMLFLYSRRKISEPIKDLQNENQSYRNDWSEVLPVVQEKYLIDMLNSVDGFYTDKMRGILEKNNISFRNSFFVSVAVRYSIAESRTNNMNVQEYKDFVHRINSYIKNAFIQRYNTFTLPASGDVLYIFLSLESDGIKDELYGLTEDVKKELAEESVETEFAVGGIYYELAGLKKSHEESIRMIKHNVMPDEMKIDVKRQKFDNSSSYSYTISMEVAFANYLVVGLGDKAKELVKNVVKKNMDANITQKAMMHLYSQILNSVFKVIHSKNLEYDIGDFGSDMEFILKKTEMPLGELYEYVMEMIDFVTREKSAYAQKTNFSEIAQYINDHYYEDLYLDNLAEKFGTNSKYLSKKLKQQFGMNFHSYLTELRITHAKELLKRSGQSIESVYKTVGFQSRSSFIRAFKTHTGVTPSEFRGMK